MKRFKLPQDHKLIFYNDFAVMSETKIIDQKIYVVWTRDNDLLFDPLELTHEGMKEPQLDDYIQECLDEHADMLTFVSACEEYENRGGVIY